MAKYLVKLSQTKEVEFVIDAASEERAEEIADAAHGELFWDDVSVMDFSTSAEWVGEAGALYYQTLPEIREMYSH